MEYWKEALAAVVTLVAGGGLGALWTTWRKGRRDDREASLKLDQAAGDWQMRTRQDEERLILEVRKKLVLELKGELDTTRRRLDRAEDEHRELRKLFDDMKGDYDTLKEEHEHCQAENASLKDRVKSLEDEVGQLREAVRKQGGGEVLS